MLVVSATPALVTHFALDILVLEVITIAWNETSLLLIGGIT